MNTANRKNVMVLVLLPFAFNIFAMSSLVTYSSSVMKVICTSVAIITMLLYAKKLFGQSNRERLDRVADVAIDSVTGLLVLDRNLRIERVNNQFSRVTGYAASQVINKSLSDLHFLNLPDYINSVSEQLISKKSWKGEFSATSRLGEKFTVSLNIKLLAGVLGRVDKYIVTFTDISQHKSKLSRLWTLVETDPLTNLWNRRRFDREMSHYSQVAKRYVNSQTVLALLDIDHFKMINDDFGHDTGDQVLQEVAGLLSENSRDTDIVFRIGGEEFAIIMPETSVSDSLEAMSRLKAIVTDRSSLGITLSCGVAAIGSSNQAYIDADKALYKAKQDGRDRVCEMASS